MNITSTVVIGANYGDEGKGLITDFEVRRTGAKTVVRFNGGAQAGHTVVDADRRHVFGHVGAGTFANAKTHLGQKFIVNPLVLERELKELQPKIGYEPIITVHPEARVSTLFDMMLNALVEIMREGSRHGSCGLGINETVTRHEHHPLTVQFLTNALYSDIFQRVHDIKFKWVPARMKELGIIDVPEPYATALDTSVPDLVHNLQELITYLRPLKPLVSPVDGVVFEGAQGLALDEFLGEFPHVTRSITGLPYAILDAANLGVTKLRPVYCTRSYLTRHGAGPLEFEGRDFNGYKVEDQTNVENAWQGSLRYAPLNLPMLHKFIYADLNRAQFVAQAHGVELLRPCLAMTCLDQLNGDVTIIDMNGEFKTLRTSYLPIYVADRLHLELSHVSRGPDHRDVEFLSRA